MLKQARDKLILTILALVVVVCLARAAPGLRLPGLATVLVFFATICVSFIRGTEGLYIVIFAMLFSPEIASGFGTGKTGGEGGGGVVLRLEDVLLLAVVLGWLLRSAYRGRRFGIVTTPVNGPIWIYMAVSIITTLLGVLRGTVHHFMAGLFHNLKYFEYFVLFFMILAHVRKKKTIVRMIWALFIVFFLAMVYGYTQIGTGERVNAPFDKEPNTFGGYIVLLMCLAAGIALVDRRARIRGVMIFLLLFACPPLLFTLSRASYLAFTAALLAFLAVSHHRILIGAVAVAVAAAMMLGLPLFPERVQERVAGTFEKEAQYHVQVAGVDFDASSSARLLDYKEALRRWVKSPVLGHGVTGIYFIDGQYPRLLAETGLVGLAAFLFVFWRLLGQVRRVYRNAGDPFLKGAATGFFCGIIALLAHAFSANSFIIIRIAEPLWLIAGLVLLIPRIEAAEEHGGVQMRQKAALG